MLDKSFQPQHNRQDNAFLTKISQAIIDRLAKMSN